MSLDIEKCEIGVCAHMPFSEITDAICQITKCLDSRISGLYYECGHMTSYGIGQNEYEASLSIDGYKFALQCLVDKLQSKCTLGFTEIKKFEVKDGN